MHLIPITLRSANAFVEQHHRHHGPARGCICCVAVGDEDEVVGVAIIGRPLSRHLQDGWTAEVLRVCTIEWSRVRCRSRAWLWNSPRNACSMLYGAAWRACRALGYRRLVTYSRCHVSAFVWPTHSQPAPRKLAPPSSGNVRSHLSFSCNG
jgi:hypothetical protein